MQYLLLLYSEQNDSPSDGSPEAVAARMAPWAAYTAALKEAGAFVGADALQPTGTATSVRVRDGDVTLTDGPFAETTEVLGGYYLIDVPDLDAAIGWAQRCPLADYGTVEIRPVVVFD
jgi:hypothetical protein